MLRVNKQEFGSGRFDDSSQWWFLTPSGFKQFDNDPVAQGYEILSRRPDFPHLSTRKHGRIASVIWEHSYRDMPRPTWLQLTPEARAAFLGAWRYELSQLGFGKMPWLTTRTVTFDCTSGITTILPGIHYSLRLSQLFKTRDYLRSRSNRDGIKIKEISPHEPHIVTLDWSQLYKQLSAMGDMKMCVAAFRTFFERDKSFKAYRAQCLKKHKENDYRSPKTPATQVVVAACVASDWQRAKRKLSELKPFLGARLDVAGMKGHSTSWTNDLRAMRKFHLKSAYYNCRNVR